MLRLLFTSATLFFVTVLSFGQCRLPSSFTISSETDFLCEGSTRTLTCPLYTGYDYLWLRGGFPVSPASTNGITYDADEPGDYVVQIFDPADGSCSVLSEAFSLTLSELEVPPVPVVESPEVICSDLEQVFSVINRNENEEVIWGIPSFLKRNIVSDNTVDITFELGENAEIEVQLSNICYTSPATVIVVDSVYQSNSHTIVIGSNTTRTIEGTPIDFQIIDSANGGSSPTYVWKVNGDSISDQPSLQLSTLEFGDEVVLETKTSNACSAPYTAVSNKLTLEVLRRDSLFDCGINRYRNLVKNGTFDAGYYGAEAPTDFYSECEWAGDLEAQFEASGECHYETYPKYFVGKNETDNCYGSSLAFSYYSPDWIFTDHTENGQGFVAFFDIPNFTEPEYILWQQDIGLLEDESIYYFSAFVQNPFGSVFNPRLRLTVQGVDSTGSLIGNENELLPFTEIYYSGTWEQIKGTWENSEDYDRLRISIIGEKRALIGNDVMIDDISFSINPSFPSMNLEVPADYCKTEPTPNIPSEASLCWGRGKVTINSEINPNNNLNFKWYKDGTALDYDGPSLTVFEPGEYEVCVDSIGLCPNRAKVTVVSEMILELGANQHLCIPSSVLLDTQIEPEAGFEINWAKAGSPISFAQNSRTLNINSPGIYAVQVVDSACGGTDFTVVTSELPIPQEAIICESAADVTLEVLGDGDYTWYDQLNEGLPVQDGDSLAISSVSGSSTYFVQDTKLRTGSFDSTFDVIRSRYTGPDRILIKAKRQIVLDSLAYECPSYFIPGRRVTIRIYNGEENVLDLGNLIFEREFPWEIQQDSLYHFPISLQLEENQFYWIQLYYPRSNAYFRYIQLPISDQELGHLEIISSADPSRLVKSGVALFDNLWYSYKPSCDRVPVRVIDTCETTDCRDLGQVTINEGYQHMTCAGENNINLSTQERTNLSYQWYDQNGTLGETGFEIKQLGPGKYYVEVSSEDCLKSSPVATIVEDVCTQTYSTSKIKHFKIHPNPSNDGTFKISSSYTSLHIQDIRGKKIYQQEGLANPNFHLQPGVYLVTINSSDFSETVRLIVQ